MIPKVIHYCWFGRGEKPELARKCIASWKKYCPDYKIIEWNEDNLDLNLNRYAKEAYEAKKWGFVPDYFRLWIVFNYGGIYLDTDVQLLKSLDPLLDNHAFCGFEQSSAPFFAALGLGFGAEKGDPTVEKLMRQYDELRFTNEDGSFNQTPSPQYSTQLLCKYGLDTTSNTIQIVDTMTVYPYDYFCPKSFETGLSRRTENTFSIHHYDSSWLDDEGKEYHEMKRRLAKRDHLLHTPNRIARRILGDNRYSRIKSMIKKNSQEP